MFAIANVGMKYVDRGDLAAYDFDINDFTFDGTWNELDLSSIVPKNAKLVILGIVERSYNGFPFYFRTKGNSNEVNVKCFNSEGVGGYRVRHIEVAPDKNRIIEYYVAGTANINVFNVAVCGYFV